MLFIILKYSSLLGRWHPFTDRLKTVFSKMYFTIPTPFLHSINKVIKNHAIHAFYSPMVSILCVPTNDFKRDSIVFIFMNNESDNHALKLFSYNFHAFKVIEGAPPIHAARLPFIIFHCEIGESLFGRQFCCISDHTLVHLA